MNLSRALVEHVHAIRYETLPEEARDRAKYFLLDFLGVALRGGEAASSRVLRSFIRKRTPQDGPCTVIGSPLRTDAPYAALANGGIAHALEMDDVTTRSSLHPAVSVMPSTLAVAEAHRPDPKRVIAAIVAGYEVTNRVGNAVNPTSHYKRGFHPTGTCGAFAASVTASKMLGLSPEAAASAFGIAGSQAAGSMQYLDNGAWTKRFHPGWAAHSGIIAAYLAQEGFTGPEDILGGPSGFLHGYSDDAHPEYVLEHLGEYWEICLSAIKPHACCRYNHAPVDAVIGLCKAHDIRPEEVRGVEVRVPETCVMLVVEPEALKTAPQNVVDAQFSLQYAVAVALLRRRAGLEEYQDDFLRSQVHRSVIGKIRCLGDAELEKAFPGKWQARVRIDTARGPFEAHVEHPKGDPRNPLSWEELIERFHDMAGPVLDAAARRLLVERVRGLERLASITEVTELAASAEGTRV
ncbi:MAG: MmgE/PrpD family protein [Candidatus Tectomicrobia bacterium]|uniref:MmgE/PrpD family protein n=1 Tax=Tectimicrobiota bacterium TaxID=2528274 RepID=A0A932MPN0_UNCTE|nr:MmgE/PrpD family protein [Candidatus Tectomicrobia bacterium]